MVWQPRRNFITIFSKKRIVRLLSHLPALVCEKKFSFIDENRLSVTGQHRMPVQGIAVRSEATGQHRWLEDEKFEVRRDEVVSEINLFQTD